MREIKKIHSQEKNIWKFALQFALAIWQPVDPAKVCRIISFSSLKPGYINRYIAK